MNRILALLLTALVTAGCTTSKQPTPIPSDEVTTIRILGGSKRTLEHVITAFHDQYPQYRIEHTPGPDGNVAEMIRTRVQAGEVDIFEVRQFEGALENSLLLRLDEFIARSNLDLTPFGRGLNSLTWQGSFYDLPAYLSPTFLLYNPHLFVTKNQEPPSPDWTWEDFRRVAVSMTSGEGSEKVWGFSDFWPEGAVRVWLGQRSRGDVWQIVEDDLREVLTYFYELIYVHAAMPQSNPRDLTQFGTTTTGQFFDHNYFAQGKAALGVGSMSLEGVDSRAEGVLPYPRQLGGVETSVARPTTFGIASTTNQPDAAWAFLKFLCGPEGSRILASQGVLTMYRTPEIEQAWHRSEQAQIPGIKAIYQHSWVVENRTSDERTTELSSALTRIINQVLSGEIDPERAASLFQTERERLQQSTP